MRIFGSIVLYNTDRDILTRAIDSFLDTSLMAEKKLYLIDNSPNDLLSDIANYHSDIIYISNPSNPGFGASHNIAIIEAINREADYHFVINPDISVDQDVVFPMIEYMESHKNVGMMMPAILNSDGSRQFLPKLLPSPYSVFMRKFKRPKAIYEPFINRYELRNVPEDKIYSCPILSGCFTLFRTSVLKELDGYDDRFFMYFEDWDLSRRIHEKYQTIYFPKVWVFHDYESGANHNRRLFKIFLQSAIRYFNKWGWFFDIKRRKFNRKTLEQFSQL